MHSVSNAYVYGSLSIRGIEYELCLTKACPRGRFCACRQPRFRLPSLHRSVACVFTSHCIRLFQNFSRMGVKNRAAWECRTNYYSQILFLCQAKCLLFRGDILDRLVGKCHRSAARKTCHEVRIGLGEETA